MNRLTHLRKVATIGFVVTGVTVLGIQPAFAQVSLQDLLDAGVSVAGQMERERIVPETISVGSDEVNPAEFLWLAASGILEYARGNTNPDQLFTVPVIASPAEYYPPLEMLSPAQELVYDRPFHEMEYQRFLETVQVSLSSQVSMFPARNGVVRFADAVHFAAAILRHVAFFNTLPRLQDLKLISPIGLVPWQTPQEESEFISLLTRSAVMGSPRGNRFYWASAGQYQTFKQAKEVIGDASDPWTAAARIYDWVRWDTWIKFGYYTFLTQYWGEVSGPERWRIRMSTSGEHTIKNLALLRALGIPARNSQVYLPPHGWVNYDVHRSFGAEPVALYDSTRWSDEAPDPTLDDPLIQQVRYIASLAGSDTGQKDYYVVINGADVLMYGADYIATQAKNGRLSGIVLNAKTTMGYLYYQSALYPNRVLFDALTPLIQAGQRQGLKIYAGFNVLNDKLTVREHVFDQTRWNQPPNLGPSAISPCQDEYRHINKTMLEELVSAGIDGVLLHSLYFMFGDRRDEPDPNCDSYRTGDDWQYRVINSYAQDLTQSIKALNPNLKVVMNSVPLHRGNFYSAIRKWPGQSDQGHDLAALAAVVDELVLTFNDNVWLTFRDEREFSGDDPVTTRLQELSGAVRTALGLSFYFNDEWEFPVEYYQGLNPYFDIASVQSIFFTSPVSGFGGEVVGWEVNPEGEAYQGPSFTRLQWEKIGVLDLNSAANKPQVLHPIGNKVITENTLLQFAVRGDDSFGNPLAFRARPLPSGALFLPLGDVSLDGSLTSVDALLIRQYVEGSIQFSATQFAVADIDGNGFIQQIDAELLLAVIVGMEPPLNEYRFLWTPTLEQAGAYFVTFTVSDGRINDFETISIVVANFNAPPRLDSIGHQIVSETQPLAFTVSANDPENDQLTFNASPRPARARFVPLGDVTLDGALALNDAQLLQRYIQGLDTLTPDSQAVADVDENGKIEDADAQLIMLFVTEPPRMTKYRFLWTPDFGQAGSYQITFSVSDGASTDSETITIAVASLRPSPCHSFGDVDNDGFVTPDDSEFVLQYVTGFTTLTFDEKQRADVDGSPGVESTDALMILQYAWGIGDVFPVCSVPPATPAGLTAQAVSSSQIALTWTDVLGEERHELDRSLRLDFGRGVTTLTMERDLTTYADTGLKAGQTYYYRLRACNAVGCSAYSTTATATTLNDGGGGGNGGGGKKK